MQNIQDVYNRIQEIKSEQKTIRAQYKDALASRSEYSEVVDELKRLRERKKQIESVVQKDMEGDTLKLDKLKTELAELTQSLADLALTTYAKGQTVEIFDADQVRYEPVFSVKFRKTR